MPIPTEPLISLTMSTGKKCCKVMKIRRTAWEEKFMAVMHQCILTAKLSMKSRVLWISRDITKAMRARNLSFRRVKKTGRLDHRNDYNKKWNKVANMLKSAKLKYFKKLKFKKLECVQKSGLCHIRTCWRSAVYRSSLLGGITLVSASYIKSLMENVFYRMLHSRHTLPPTPPALMKLIVCIAFCAYQLAPGLIFSSCNLIVELSSCISSYYHIPTLLQKAVNTYSLNLFVCHLHHIIMITIILSRVYIHRTSVFFLH